jgi:hypothetical protein
MKKVISLGLGVLALAIPALALADSLQASFSGYSAHPTSAAGVFAANEPFTARVVLDTTQDDPWYPFDQLKEYTAILNAEVLFYLGGMSQAVSFKPNGTVLIYEDSSPDADFANLATLTDGTLILTGQVNNMAGTRINIPGLPWSVSGEITLLGGAGFGNLVGCAAGGQSLSMNDFIAWQLGNGQPLPGIPTGYKEAYDAEWKCLDDTTSLDSATWGGVKSLYR